MKTILLLLLLQSAALSQTITGAIKTTLATNWTMLATRECTNNCCRDKWPATMKWEGTVVTNSILVFTNAADVYTIRLADSVRQTDYTKPVIDVKFGVAVESVPSIISAKTNKVAAIEAPPNEEPIENP